MLPQSNTQMPWVQLPVRLRLKQGDDRPPTNMDQAWGATVQTESLPALKLHNAASCGGRPITCLMLDRDMRGKAYLIAGGSR